MAASSVRPAGPFPRQYSADGGIAPTAVVAGDDFNTLNGLRHRRMPRLKPRHSGSRQVSGRIGGWSEKPPEARYKCRHCQGMIVFVQLYKPQPSAAHDNSLNVITKSCLHISFSTLIKGLTMPHTSCVCFRTRVRAVWNIIRDFINED